MSDEALGSEAMTKDRIEQIFERVRTWPLEQQERPAAMLLLIEEQGTGVYELADEKLADIEEAEAEAELGEFAADEEVKALFDRYRRP